MRLLRVALTDVRGVARCEVRFDPAGVTVVEAPNEAGKSTVLDAVDIVLELKDSSTKAIVRALQPVGRDVGSTIEVELTCGVTHLTCTKTYNRDRATVLTVHGTSPEVLTGAEAHDRLRTILEAQVDLALLAALRFRQGRDLDAVAFGGSDALAARLDAAAGGSGSGDDGGLLDRAEREYLRWFTPTGRDTSALTECDRDVTDALAHHTDLATRLADLERDIEDLARVDRELPEFARLREEELIPGLAAMRAHAARIDQVEADVAVQQAELRRASAVRSAACDARDGRARALARADQLQHELDDHDARLGPRRARADALDLERDERAAQLRAVGVAATQAADARDRAQRVADLVGAVAERDDLARRRARIDALLDAARDAERALAGLRIDDDRLRAVRAAVQDLRVAQATLAAGAPAVHVVAHRAIEVALDGQPSRLDAGQELTTAVGDRLRLGVPDVVEVEVRAGTSADDLLRTVELAGQRLADACRDAGATDADDAEALAAQRSAHQAALDRRDEELARELDGRGLDEISAALRAAEDRVTALQAALPDDDPLPDPQAARAAAVSAAAAARTAADDHATCRAAYDELLATAQEQRTAVRIAQSQQAARREELDRITARLTEDRADRTDAALDAAVDAAQAAERTAREQLDTTEAELAGLEPDVVALQVGNLEAQLVDLEGRVRAAEERRATLRERLRLGGEAGLGEALAQADDVLRRARTDQRRVRARAAAARMLWEHLVAARDEAYQAYRAPLRESIAGKLRLLVGGDVAVDLGDDLAIVARTRDGIRLGWDQLSAGAREQLSIIAGLAAAELAGPDGVPFVLDDALGYTDPDRLERIGALLGRTTDAQVIVLTCVADRFRHVGGARTVRLLDAR